ncbi:hypothetical protein ISS98_07250 [Dyella flagellata]
MNAAPLGAKAATTTASTTNVLSNIPQFGIYNSSMPANYSPPAGVVMIYTNGTWYSLAKLTTTQQQELGSDLSAKLTYFAGCDNYDRNGGLVFLAMPNGHQPTAADIASSSTEMAHFQTTFNDYTQAYPTYVFPLISIQQYAAFLADTTHDIWVGISGGANPYNGDVCQDSNGNINPSTPVASYPTGLTKAQGQAIYAASGFAYSLDLSWTQAPVTANADAVVTAVATVKTGASTSTNVPLSYYQYGNSSYATLPIAGTITVPAPGNGASTVTGTITVTIDSHGPNAEYFYNTPNTLKINGVPVGASFSTLAECSAYANSTINPGNPYLDAPPNTRNWCNGSSIRPTPADTSAPMTSVVIPNVTLNSGSNTFELDLGAATAPSYGSGVYTPGSGDYYLTSINFAPSATGATSPPPTAVDLSSYFNVNGIYTDGTSFSTGGLDSDGYAYSSQALGTSLTFNGQSFALGAANSPDAASGGTITLPAGQFSTLSLLGTGINGNQVSQNFIVTYTDGSSTTFTQSVSDWYTPQQYAGEAVAAATAYRDAYNGTQENQTFNLYGYSFNLNKSKSVKSIQLPANRNVVILGMGLQP